MALKKREKQFLLFAAVAVAILAFDQLYYTPQSRKISRLKEEVKASGGKIEELRLLEKTLEGLEAGVARLEAETKGFEGRILTPEKLNGFLRHLGKESHRLQMKIISLNPETEKPPSDGEKSDRPLSRRVRLKMVLHSRYDSLLKYLKGLEDPSFFVRVNHLQVEREEKIHPLLRTTLVLNVYLSSPDGKEIR